MNLEGLSATVTVTVTVRSAPGTSEDRVKVANDIGTQFSIDQSAALSGEFRRKLEAL